MIDPVQPIQPGARSIAGTAADAMRPIASGQVSRHSPIPSAPTSRARTARASWLALALRCALFAGAQAVFALGFAVAGSAAPWRASIRWWPVSATLANLANLAVLAWLVRGEHRGLRSLYGLDDSRWRRDVVRFVALLFVIAPVAVVPNVLLASAIWSDPSAGTALLFQPLPLPALVAVFALLPVSIALTELPTYFGYLAPRLRSVSPRVAVVVVACVLALQHAAPRQRATELAGEGVRARDVVALGFRPDARPGEWMYRPA